MNEFCEVLDVEPLILILNFAAYGKLYWVSNNKTFNNKTQLICEDNIKTSKLSFYDKQCN